MSNQCSSSGRICVQGRQTNLVVTPNGSYTVAAATGGRRDELARSSGATEQRPGPRIRARPDCCPIRPPTCITGFQNPTKAREEGDQHSELESWEGRRRTWLPLSESAVYPVVDTF